MATINAGSIATNIFSSISPMPNSVSGLLITYVNNQVFFVSNFVGDAGLTSTSIAEKYQPAIYDLSTANTLRTMAVQDLGINQVRVNDLTTDNSNLLAAAKLLQDNAMVELKLLARSPLYYKARG